MSTPREDEMMEPTGNWHTTEAESLSRMVSGYCHSTTDILALAQVHATLALAHEQRTANKIAVLLGVPRIVESNWWSSTLEENAGRALLAFED